MPRRNHSVAKPPMTQAFESGRRFSTCGIRVRPHRSGLPMPVAGRSGLRKPNRVSDGNLSVGRKPNRISDGDLRSLRRSSLPMPVAGRSLRPPGLSSLRAALASPSWLRSASKAGSRARAGPRSPNALALRHDRQFFFGRKPNGVLLAKGGKGGSRHAFERIHPDRCGRARQGLRHRYGIGTVECLDA